MLLPLMCLVAVLARSQAVAQEPPTALAPRPEVVPAEVAVGDLVRNDGRSETWDLDRRAVAVLTYPLALPAVELDHWGWRFSPSRNAWRMHTGIDLIVAEGTTVLAVLPGRVRLVERIDGYGLTVVIDHGHGLQSLYGHLLEAAVMPGDAIDAGGNLGRVGRSGNATTPHLHLELRRHTPAGLMAVDPTPLLSAAPPSLAARPAVPPAEPPIPPPPFPDSASGP
jgi:murein DD-endopeptidase MepM/ murein hydrolase activator NlpD